MKQIIFWLLVIAFFALIFLLPACNIKVEKAYTEQTQDQFNALKSPVVLIGKHKSFGDWGITVKDGRDSVLTIGNMSTLANDIGNYHNVGDTIK